MKSNTGSTRTSVVRSADAWPLVTMIVISARTVVSVSEGTNDTVLPSSVASPACYGFYGDLHPALARYLEPIRDRGTVHGLLVVSLYKNDEGGPCRGEIEIADGEGDGAVVLIQSGAVRPSVESVPFPFRVRGPYAERNILTRGVDRLNRVKAVRGRV